MSKEEKACAPAHSFCIIPRKLTIWLQSTLKCAAGEDEILPVIPPRPSWISCFNDHPAQYPVSMDKSWI